MVKFKIKQRIMHRTLSYRSDMSCTSTVIISDLIYLHRFIADYTRPLIHNLSLFNFALDLCFVLVDIVFLIATVTIMRFFLCCCLIHYLRMDVFYVDLLLCCCGTFHLLLKSSWVSTIPWEKRKTPAYIVWLVEVQPFLFSRLTAIKEIPI